METPSPPQPQIVYETLRPLAFSDSNSNSNSNSDSYTVLRTEINLSSHYPTLLNSSPSAAPDYFSLDVDPYPVPEPEPEPEPVTPAGGSVEPMLESSWFRGGKFSSPMLRLHKEIVDFCDFLSPTPEERGLRSAAIDGVFDVIKYIWPHCKPEIFGSVRTGLYLPTSDIDVVILGSGNRSPQLGLQALSRALSQRGIAKKIQVIAKARVPIVKFVEKKSGLSFDISFDVENGPKAADHIKNAMLEWPALRPLCLILKVFLQQRELNEVYTGGIGSYALLAMLMGLLRIVRESQPFPENNLGVLLVHFFDIYGRKLNTADVGVSCNGAGTFFSKKSKGFYNKERPFLISIEDPQAPENDIGKNSFNYFQIRSAFNMAFLTLTNPKTIIGLGPNRSILGTIIRPDPLLVERKGGSKGDVTFNSLLPGAGEPLQLENGDRKEIFCNWLMDDEDPLPRGNGVPEDASAHSSGKKRKSSKKEKSSKKKKKENGKILQYQI